MNQYLKTIIIIVIIIAGIFTLLYFLGESFINKFSPTTEITGNSENKSGEVSIGKMAPYFNLPSVGGARVRFSDLSDNANVITFWSTWNSTSVDQIKILDDYLAKNSSSNKKLPINIIAINSQETQNVVSNFIRRGGYEMKVLIDENGEVSNSYGIQTLPMTFFIDNKGVVSEIFVGTLSESMLVDKIEKILY